MRSISYLASLAVLVGVWAGAAETEVVEARPAALAIEHGPYLQVSLEESMTVVWTTNRPCVSKVEYWEAGDGAVRTAVRSRHGLIEANTTKHRVRLTGLKAGRRYRYRAVSREIVDFKPYKVVFGETVASAEGEFTTLDSGKKRFSFVVLNDRHERVAALKTALGAIEWEGVDLVFYNGDMINDPGKEQQIYGSVVDPSVELFAKRVPFVYVRGNHETRGALARSFMDYFPTPNDRYYYSFQHGGVHFLILDAGEDKGDSNSEYSGLVDFESYLKEETEWLKEEIRGEAFGKARYRVVLVHIPPRNLEDAKFIREKWVLENWGPMLKEGKVDLVLSGHTHRFQEIRPGSQGNGYAVIIGGTETVIRVDVGEDEMEMVVRNNDGTSEVTSLRLPRK